MLLLLSWRLRLSWRTERLKLRLGLRRQGREDEAHRRVFPSGKGVREREGVEGNGCGSRGGGGSVAGSGAGLGRGGTRPQPGGVGRGRKRELVSGGRRAGGSGRGRGGRAKGVYKRDEREILVVWLKAAAQCWLIRGECECRCRQYAPADLVDDRVHVPSLQLPEAGDDEGCMGHAVDVGDVERVQRRVEDDLAAVSGCGGAGGGGRDTP